MWRNECDQARLDIQVERDLRVTVAPAKPIVGPGEPVELEVTTVDQLGRPVSAELSIAMVDQSLLRLFGDTLPAIGPFFYNQTRTGAFATETTNTFRYAPATVPVSQAVVDEAERDGRGGCQRGRRQARHGPGPDAGVLADKNASAAVPRPAPRSLRASLQYRPERLGQGRESTDDASRSDDAASPTDTMDRGHERPRDGLGSRDEQQLGDASRREMARRLVRRRRTQSR